MKPPAGCRITDSASRSKLTVQDLPDDVILEITAYLPLLDTVQLKLVSKTFKRVLEGDYAITNLYDSWSEHPDEDGTPTGDRKQGIQRMKAFLTGKPVGYGIKAHPYSGVFELSSHNIQLEGAWCCYFSPINDDNLLQLDNMRTGASFSSTASALLPFGQAHHVDLRVMLTDTALIMLSGGQTGQTPTVEIRWLALDDIDKGWNVRSLPATKSDNEMPLAVPKDLQVAHKSCVAYAEISRPRIGQSENVCRYTIFDTWTGNTWSFTLDHDTKIHGLETSWEPQMDAIRKSIVFFEIEAAHDDRADKQLVIEKYSFQGLLLSKGTYSLPQVPDTAVQARQSGHVTVYQGWPDHAYATHGRAHWLGHSDHAILTIPRRYFRSLQTHGMTLLSLGGDEDRPTVTILPEGDLIWKTLVFTCHDGHVEIRNRPAGGSWRGKLIRRSPCLKSTTLLAVNESYLLLKTDDGIEAWTFDQGLLEHGKRAWEDHDDVDRSATSPLEWSTFDK